MLSTAFISDTSPARRAKSASVLAALSRIVWAKADHNGICTSVMPSCDWSVRIRWSTAALVAADISGGADGAVAGATAPAEGGAVEGATAGAGGIAAADGDDCARQTEGTSNVAKAMPRTMVGVNMTAP